MKRHRLFFLIKNNHYFSKIAVVIFIILSISLKSQQHKILIVDNFDIPISNINVNINQNIYKTDSKGKIDFDGRINEILIDENDYHYKDENIEKDGFYKITLAKIKTKDIDEVLLIKNDSIINPYEPKREVLSFTCSSKNKIAFSSIVLFSINKHFTVKNYSFFIMSTTKFNVPFNFVIYKKNGENIEKLKTILIKDYNKNDNTIDLTSSKIHLSKGEYYFGMEWIINDNMIEKTRREFFGKKFPGHEVIGQELAGSIKNKKPNQSYSYKNGKLNSSNKISFQQLKICF